MYTKEIKRMLISMAVLLPLSAFAYYSAYWLRFDGELSSTASQVLNDTLGWVLAVKVLVICLARLHQEYTRYISFRDLLTLARTVTLCTIGITLVDTMFLVKITIPRSVVLLDWGVSLALLAMARALPRLIHNSAWRSFSSASSTRALIIGANDPSESLLRTIRQSSVLRYRLIGFADDQPNSKGRRIAGIPILGALDEIPTLVEKHRIEEVLLTAGSLPGKQVRAIVELAAENDFRLKVLPSYEQLLQERVDVQPRSVAISDLLQRPSVELDEENIQQWIEDQTVLVTGSSGSIGSEICRQILSHSPSKLVVIDRSETGQFLLERELRRLFPAAEIAVVLADLTDEERLRTVFSDHRPNIVFHAAAYKHVPLMEAHVGEAVKNIVLATRHVVDLAEDFECETLVMISTDKAVNPTSVMGSCKRLAEQYLQSKASTSNCRLVTVRFGNVLDSSGSVVPIFRDQIARGGPVTVTHPEMIRYFMLIPEAAQLVIQAGTMGQGGEIFVLDMGEPVPILNLAKDMIRLSGLREGEDIEIEFSGLRPGEKLYEELYSEHELHSVTTHPKIMVAEAQARNLLEVLKDISHLTESLELPNDIQKSQLREIIPVQEAGSALPATLKHAA